MFGDLFPLLHVMVLDPPVSDLQFHYVLLNLIHLFTQGLLFFPVDSRSNKHFGIISCGISLCDQAMVFSVV